MPEHMDKKQQIIARLRYRTFPDYLLREHWENFDPSDAIRGVPGMVLRFGEITSMREDSRKNASFERWIPASSIIDIETWTMSVPALSKDRFTFFDNRNRDWR